MFVDLIVFFIFFGPCINFPCVFHTCKIRALGFKVFHKYKRWKKKKNYLFINNCLRRERERDLS